LCDWWTGYLHRVGFDVHDGAGCGGEGVDYAAVFAALPSPCVVLNPEFVICGINDACVAAVGRDRSTMLGANVFAAFPDNPHDPDADGVAALRACLQTVLTTGKPASMWVQRYDIPVAGSPGLFQQRYWSPVSAPVLGPDGAVRWIVHRVDDVTAVRTELMKALEFYPSELAEEHGHDTDAARRFAEYATVSLSNAHLFADLAAEVEQMRQAMKSRAVIEQAKGIIMGERRCSPDEGFDVLVQLSQDTNRKLRDVAAALVATAHPSAGIDFAAG